MPCKVQMLLLLVDDIDGDEDIDPAASELEEFVLEFEPGYLVVTGKVCFKLMAQMHALSS